MAFRMSSRTVCCVVRTVSASCFADDGIRHIRDAARFRSAGQAKAKLVGEKPKAEHLAKRIAQAARKRGQDTRQHSSVNTLERVQRCRRGH